MSIATTIFGPKISFTTTGTNDPAAGRVAIDVPLDVTNAATLSSTVATTGAVTATSTVDITGGDLLPAAITAKPTTSNLVDGELSLTSISVTSAILAYRSGNTVYTFTNAAAE